jgi:hypothetical protein
VDVYETCVRPRSASRLRKVSFHAISKHARLTEDGDDPMYKVHPDNVYLDSYEAQLQWHGTLDVVPLGIQPQGQ